MREYLRQLHQKNDHLLTISNKNCDIRVRIDGYVPCFCNVVTGWSTLQPQMPIPIVLKGSTNFLIKDVAGSHPQLQTFSTC